MRIRANYFVALGLLLAGAGCLVAYRLIGSYIDENGVLIEPFFLIPVGQLMVFVGLVIALVALIRTAMKRFRSR